MQLMELDLSLYISEIKFDHFDFFFVSAFFEELKLDKLMDY